MKNISVICGLFLGLSSLFSQNVGINTLNPDASSVLYIDFQDRGLLTPIMSTAQRNAIVNLANGLLVYDTDFNCFYYWRASTTQG